MTIKFLTLSSESELHSPALDLLAPLHVNSPLPVPLICLASGLNDTGRVKVDWEVDSEEDVLKELSPTILPDTRAGVFNSQVYVPAETWSAGVNVSCVLSDGELRIRRPSAAGQMRSNVSHCLWNSHQHNLKAFSASFIFRKKQKAADTQLKSQLSGSNNYN